MRRVSELEASVHQFMLYVLVTVKAYYNRPPKCLLASAFRMTRRTLTGVGRTCVAVPEVSATNRTVWLKAERRQARGTQAKLSLLSLRAV
jgi:hypothetical protein